MHLLHMTSTDAECLLVLKWTLTILRVRLASPAAALPVPQRLQEVAVISIAVVRVVLLFGGVGGGRG